MLIWTWRAGFRDRAQSLEGKSRVPAAEKEGEGETEFLGL